MRIDESKIFNAYLESLLVEKKKKGLPPWLKDKGEDKKEDKKEGKKEDKKDKKGKKLPPWLKKKGKKAIKESHETLPEESTSMSVYDLLDELQTTDPELYQRIEDYLSGREDSIEPTMADAEGFESSEDIGEEEETV